MSVRVEGGIGYICDAETPEGFEVIVHYVKLLVNAGLVELRAEGSDELRQGVAVLVFSVIFVASGTD